MKHAAWCSLVVFGAAMLAAGSSAARAEGLPGGASSLSERHGDWTVNCMATESLVRCAMSQTQVQGEGRQRVLTVELAVDGEATPVRGVLVLPFGLRLDAGVMMAIDETTPMPSLAFSTCLPAGCLVPLELNAGSIAMLQGGSALQVSAVANDTGAPVKLSISLSGFASALGRAVDLTRADP